ncbi:glycoside hydrolase family 18 protein [Amanita thiersii Skay4041]|uniref:Glycoside hydrolase family 18 protein n=1 Tax=Amanita thiersii Skay4041 TaxID=703135 RepID=A0A2A9NPC7_9AGAR|nr:glycoside hydrolase family 18 protein [Amanita thiersii Skay4041]
MSDDIPSPPHWFSYSDQWMSAPPDASTIPCINVFALCFLLTKGAWDNAQQWTTFTDAQRQQIKTAYNNAGIKLIVSAFGDTDIPTTNKVDPVKCAQTFADWVKQYDLDGIDVDYEDLGAFQNGTAEKWLIDFTTELRNNLPKGQYIVTHAPLAPWFMDNKTAYPGGGYLYIDQQIGDMIDWYNVQFYNQGDDVYQDCNNLLFESTPLKFPKTSVFEINAAGVPLSKIVIGKPATKQDATTGYMDPTVLAGCLETAKGKGWDAGVMTWQYPRGDSAWFKTVRAQSWPCECEEEPEE